jgi:release factor glutamine methyltransferase
MPQHQTRVWTIRELMTFAIDHLRRHGIADARLNVELLLSHALQCERIELYTNFDKPLTSEELRGFRALYERRLNREPVQYLVGSASFMGLLFKVDRRALVPRPETETLVEQAMLVCQRCAPDRRILILEVGTGCGNIAVALAKFVRNAFVTSFDISKSALEVAHLNAEAHGVQDRTSFVPADVFGSLEGKFPGPFELLVSNPPYVPLDEWGGLQQEIRNFEPQLAVTDMSDGYRFHKRIIELAPRLLREGGQILLELGYGQSEKVLDMMKAAGYSDVFVAPDLQGVPRVAIGSCPAGLRAPHEAN